ncbi:TPA: hypothetical protein RSU94_002482 [Pseudomonas aeruginosa]|uniref:hypothetical protein n=1 Tax=Pseudomonas aeruginosa group TaxID=136841 RepID=UPI00070CADDC|nr:MULTISPECIES: hypothetical protein [Pseudomonas aeruginosa group]EIU1445418.1 hypothetical protein [Pseudomonas aeruginosa]ELH7020838.1 hypothetical protein [Pseudomonas aeruginosa]ELN2061704.1 hypothetical protein [Pseudomonas aeruginosa]ELQ3335759.1 hypothetical protein [Pseudomonas aeruginosa]MBG4759485.1 hypothetical protein [Pseudomonas aeruginosa]
MLSALGYIVARVGDQIYGAGRTEHDAIKLAAARLQASEGGVRALLVDGRAAAEEMGDGTLYIAPCTHALLGMVQNLDGIVAWANVDGVECTPVERDDYLRKAP